MAPRKINNKNDLGMSNRLTEERKKIWNSREKFHLDTGLSSRTLGAYETNECEVSSAMLKEIAIRGGDVHYILTGERKGESGGENKAVDMQLVKKLQAENTELKETLRNLNEYVKMIKSERDKAVEESRTAGYLHNNGAAGA